MLYIYELFFQQNKSHIISRLLRGVIDFLPKFLKVEQLSQTELWADFEEISIKIHKVFGRDFTHVIDIWACFHRKIKSWFQYSYFEL